MKRKPIVFAALICVLIFGATGLVGCAPEKWKTEFDTSLPTLLSSDGWVQTMNDEFASFDSVEDLFENSYWRPSNHGQRFYEYWCPQMLEIDKTEGALVVHSERKTDHVCDVCGVSEGVFTGGIDTCIVDENGYNPTFSQAFGYFETTVKVPRGTGMWSAFWLHTNGATKVGNKGRDGTEIDVYESSFIRANPTKTGNALHYDAYAKPLYKWDDHVTDVGYDLYDGEYHTYSLLWTPDRYVFYVDNNPVWATNYGGVSQVAQFLRLTVEIRDAKYGPYGQKIGTFKNADDDSNDFCIKSVNVWQKEEYKASIAAEADFKDMRGPWTTRNNILYALGAVAFAALVAGGAVLIKRKIKAKTMS